MERADAEEGYERARALCKRKRRKKRGGAARRGGRESMGMKTKGGGKGSALAPYGCWDPLSLNPWSTREYLYVSVYVHAGTTPQ